MKTQDKAILLGVILITTLLNGCIVSNNIMVTPALTFMPPATANMHPLPFTQVPTLGADDAFGILRNYLKNKPPC